MAALASSTTEESIRHAEGLIRGCSRGYQGPPPGDDLREDVADKVAAYKASDAENDRGRTILADVAYNFLLRHAPSKCWNCGCTLTWVPRGAGCMRQYSFDRIDNERAHCKGNMWIICHRCNVSRGAREQAEATRGEGAHRPCTCGCQQDGVSPEIDDDTLKQRAKHWSKAGLGKRSAEVNRMVALEVDNQSLGDVVLAKLQSSGTTTTVLKYV